MSLKMIALASLAAPAALLAAPSAQAEVIFAGEPQELTGIYLTTEANSGWRGDDYKGSTIDVRVGYEAALSDTVEAYIEVGPAFLMPDGSDNTTEVGAEIGASIAATDHLEFYGEFEVISGDLNDYGTKFGATYRF